MSTKEKESTASPTPLIPDVGMVRLLYLDNLRSFALFLGIIFHAAIVYAPKIGYAIQDDLRSDLFGYFCYFIHSFRMPLFYIISGYFSALVWDKKGMGSYLEGRFHRIFIPMCFGLIFLSPIQYYLVAKLQIRDLGFINFYPNYFTERFFGHSHIWFLVDLLLFSLLFILTPKNLLKYLADLFPTNQVTSSIAYVMLTFSFTLMAHSFFPRGDDFYGIDKLTFVYQFGFFLVGVISFYNKSIFDLNQDFSLLRLFTLLLAGLIVFLLFYELEISDPLWMPYFSYGVERRAVHIFLWCLSPILWTKFFVLTFQSLANVTNSFTTYLIDSSLPIYLLHHPISLIVAFYFRSIPMNVYLKCSLHAFVVLSLSFIIYDTLIKNTTILRKIFGLK